MKNISKIMLAIAMVFSLVIAGIGMTTTDSVSYGELVNGPMVGFASAHHCPPPPDGEPDPCHPNDP